MMARQRPKLTIGPLLVDPAAVVAQRKATWELWIKEALEG